MKTYLLLIIGLFVVSTTMSAQFDVEAYKEYLKDHENMTYDDLISEFPIGLFKSDAPTIFEKSEYADSIKKAYNLTDYELSLINNHSFMVSDRLSHYTFIHAYWDIFIKDLPVYISADAMLHALHYTFSKVLVSVEENLLYDRLDSALSKRSNTSLVSS